MASNELRSRVGRKLFTAKDKQNRQPGAGPMHASTSQLDSDKLNIVDSQEDFASCQNMNQSIFQMITAAGAKMDFGSRFGDSDSSDDEEDGDTSTPKASSPKQSRFIKPLPRNPSSSDRLHKSMANLRVGESSKTREEQPKRSPLAEQGLQGQAQAQKEPQPVETPAPEKPSDSDRLVQLQAELNPSTLGAKLQAREENETGEKKDRSHELPQRLREIFGLPETEEIITEYPCWLLKSVLLQGYIYITKRHILFYSYLPKKSNHPLKSGYLAKKGRSSSRYHRYWFILKGDVLSYYSDPSDLYFPSGNVDLRYAIQAELEEKDTETLNFTVQTNERIFHFRADSAASAKEWVKAIQRVIFRSHNDGDSVKIAMPVEDIIQIEESPVLEFADTYKIVVADKQDDFAIEDYYFSFFSFGQQAIEILKNLLLNQENAIPSPSPVPSSDSPSPIPGSPRTTGLQTTLDVPKQWNDSIDALERRRSGESDRLGKKNSRTIVHRRDVSVDSSGSLARSIDRDTVTSYGMNSDLHMSASENENGSAILSGDGVFKSPTLLQPTQATQSPRRSIETISAKGRPVDALAQGGKTAVEEQHNHPHLHKIAHPFKHVGGLTSWVKDHGKKVGSILTSEPMGYLEKVSDMWAGGRRHYHRHNKHASEEINDVAHEETGDETNDEAEDAQNRFRAKFALPETEHLQAEFLGYLHRVLPLYGKIYISDRHLCFHSKIPGTKTRMVLPLKDIENVDKEKGFRFGYSGLVVVIRGHEELFFEFGAADARDDCAVTLLKILGSLKESGILTKQEKIAAEAAREEHDLLAEARTEGHASHDHALPRSASAADEFGEAPPIIFDDPNASMIECKPTESLRITCLTIGSRGDVQPYIALCKGLKAEGHHVRIATHKEFKEWIEGHGIEFRQVEGDPAELMRICVENGMFTYSFLREASSKFRGWIDELLSSAWVACQDSDVLIESPSAMGGIHIAEALGIPYFRAFGMPWTRTRAYPHAFAVPERKMGGAYNYLTYVMFDNVFWKAIAGQVNRWRRKSLKIRSTNLDKLQPNKVPFIYNFSPSVVVPPLDYSDWIRVTGYWFLDEQTGWTPPEDLVAFIQRAKADGKKLVYVGFGSIVVNDPKALTRTVVESILKADVRCILSKGWSDRLDSGDKTKAEIPLPDSIFQIQQAPHDWLFQHIDVAVHHGGTGTTGASLRWGIPTIIKPFFGDQYFFGARVEDLGVGICLRKLNVSAFSKALKEATSSERMITKAKVLGESIRAEDGVKNAIQAIYRDLDYARSLIKRPSAGSSDDEEEESEEWTFIDNHLDDGEVRKISDSQTLERGRFSEDLTGSTTD